MKKISIAITLTSLMIIALYSLKKIISFEDPALYATCINKDYEMKVIAKNGEYIEIVINGVNTSEEEIEMINKYLKEKELTPDRYFTNVLAVECVQSRNQEDTNSN